MTLQCAAWTAFLLMMACCSCPAIYQLAILMQACAAHSATAVTVIKLTNWCQHACTASAGLLGADPKHRWVTERGGCESKQHGEVQAYRLGWRCCAGTLARVEGQ